MPLLLQHLRPQLLHSADYFGFSVYGIQKSAVILELDYKKSVEKKALYLTLSIGYKWLSYTDILLLEHKYVFLYTETIYGSLSERKRQNKVAILKSAVVCFCVVIV